MTQAADGGRKIELDGVGKVYPGGTRAVEDLNLTIEDGEFMVFVGPSGCGKTTALRMVAGLEEITEGTIRIGGRVVNDLSPGDRDIAMVFQNYALYPHMSVADNMSFSLRLKKTPKEQIAEKVKSVAGTIGLSDFLPRKPRALSGGQRQRVAMGRAITRSPRAFLMDEPLSNLDAKLRVQMRSEIHKLQRDLGVTTLYVTHDQVEAMTMGDRVAVIRKGRLQQVDVPQTLYDHPANQFVAGFIGSPGMNMVEAELSERDGGMVASFGDHSLAVDPALLEARPGLRAYAGRKVVLGIRPEDVDDAADAPDSPSDRRLRAVCQLREALGSEVLVHFGAGAPVVDTQDARELAADVDQAVAGDLDRRPEAVFIARLGARTPVKAGEPVELLVDTRRLHFFDEDTGAGIYGEKAVPAPAAA
jgi:multiple sugar transport system ATP-binding protein